MRRDYWVRVASKSVHTYMGILKLYTSSDWEEQAHSHALEGAGNQWLRSIVLEHSP